jgi:hypothetical protein
VAQLGSAKTPTVAQVKAMQAALVLVPEGRMVVLQVQTSMEHRTQQFHGT